MSEIVKTISFIIPAFNESARIERCVSSIRLAMLKSIQHFEIIVCDHSSSDDTAKIAAECGANVITVPAGCTVAAVRNAGAKIAKFELFVFLDADVEVSSDWGLEIDKCILEYERSPDAVFGSLCRPPISDNYFIKNWFDLTVDSGRTYLGTAHMIVPKGIFDSVYGFDEDLITGEDYDFCTRCRNSGFKVEFKNALVVTHDDYPMRVSDFLRRESWHGQGDFQSLKNFLGSKIAIASMLFFALNAVLFYSLFYGVRVFLVFLLVFLAFLLFCAKVKFRSIGVFKMLKVLPILYLYFWGRLYSCVKVISSVHAKKYFEF